MGERTVFPPGIEGSDPGPGGRVGQPFRRPRLSTSGPRNPGCVRPGFALTIPAMTDARNISIWWWAR
ncbi:MULTISPECIES: trpE operon leader peptide TrpLE [unclassified Rhizobium]|uniref:trpE operon leader peptide TrpLE n=1 Tax=unclassified Rhizobium TaxID=2613769 RepID=UPI002987FEA6|nr:MULTISPECIES: trpE operon leader peptide TrpLE [unclassified Rhizobium]